MDSQQSNNFIFDGLLSQNDIYHIFIFREFLTFANKVFDIFEIRFKVFVIKYGPVKKTSSDQKKFLVWNIFDMVSLR